MSFTKKFTSDNKSFILSPDLLGSTDLPLDCVFHVFLSNYVWS